MTAARSMKPMRYIPNLVLDEDSKARLLTENPGKWPYDLEKASPAPGGAMVCGDPLPTGNPGEVEVLDLESLREAVSDCLSEGADDDGYFPDAIRLCRAIAPYVRIR